MAVNREFTFEHPVSNGEPVWPNDSHAVYINGPVKPNDIEVEFYFIGTALNLLARGRIDALRISRAENFYEALLVKEIFPNFGSLNRIPDYH